MGGAGAAFTGENSAVLFTGVQCFIGVRGFLGDLATTLAGDLAGEQSRSCNWSAVIRLGLFVGKRALVGVGTRDCLLGDLAGVLDLGAGLVGDRKRLALALAPAWLALALAPALEGVLSLTLDLGELNRSSTWLDVSSLGDFEVKRDLVGVGTREAREADLGGAGVLDLTGLLSSMLRISSELSLAGLSAILTGVTALVTFLPDTTVVGLGLSRASLARLEQGLR